MWIGKKTLINNLVMFLPYTKGDFVKGRERKYYMLDYAEDNRFVEGIVTGFSLGCDEMLLCNVTTTDGKEASILATKAVKIEDLTKRKPSPEKCEDV